MPSSGSHGYATQSAVDGPSEVIPERWPRPEGARERTRLRGHSGTVAHAKPLSPEHHAFVTEPKRFIGGSRTLWLWKASWPLAELVIDDEGIAIRGVIWPLRWLVPSIRIACADIAYVELDASDRNEFSFRTRPGVRTKTPSWGDGVIFAAWPSQRQAIIERLASAGLDVRGRDGARLAP